MEPLNIFNPSKWSAANEAGKSKCTSSYVGKSKCTSSYVGKPIPFIMFVAVCLYLLTG